MFRDFTDTSETLAPVSLKCTHTSETLREVKRFREHTFSDRGDYTLSLIDLYPIGSKNGPCWLTVLIDSQSFKRDACAS
jgi:hypothetical protein